MMLWFLIYLLVREKQARETRAWAKDGLIDRFVLCLSADKLAMTRNFVAERQYVIQKESSD
jgi:hypothetical protein